MLIENFNVEVLRAQEIGLVQKWFGDARLYGRKINLQVTTSQCKNKAISMKDLYPILLIWLSGISFSLLMMVGELLVNRYSYVRLPYRGYLE